MLSNYKLLLVVMFIIALIVCPSFAAFVGTVISGFFQIVALVIMTVILVHLITVACMLLFSAAKTEEGVYKFA